MKRWIVVAAVVGMTLLGTTRTCAQHWSFGGNTGLSVISGSPGFQLTPTAEFLVSRNIGIGSELSVNTQYSSPILWYPYFKYYFDIHNSQLRPFAGVGPVLAMRVPNGPCLGVLFNGGVNVPVGPRLYISPNLLFGPVFGYGGGAFPIIVSGVYWGYQTWGLIPNTFPSETVFAFSIRAGIRYEI